MPHFRHTHATFFAASGTSASAVRERATSLHQQRSSGRPAAIVQALPSPQSGQRAGSGDSDTEARLAQRSVPVCVWVCASGSAACPHELQRARNSSGPQ